jgi:histidine triad (HIT) family protein
MSEQSQRARPEDEHGEISEIDVSDPDCLFCRIVSGQVPADIVAEGEHVLAFRDVSPQAPTHVLVIPREHHPNIGELAARAPEALVELVAVARQIAERECDGQYRFVANTGAAAHQTVFHAHGHVLGGRDLGWPPG